MILEIFSNFDDRMRKFINPLTATNFQPACLACWLVMLVAQFLALLGLQAALQHMRHLHVFSAGCPSFTPLHSLRCSSVVQRSFCFWLSPQKAGRTVLCCSSICSSAGAPDWWGHGIREEDRTSMGSGCLARAAAVLAFSESPESFCWEHPISSTYAERTFSVFQFWKLLEVVD